MTISKEIAQAMIMFYKLQYSILTTHWPQNQTHVKPPCCALEVN